MPRPSPSPDAELLEEVGIVEEGQSLPRRRQDEDADVRPRRPRWEEDDEDYEIRPRPRRQGGNWRLVRVGVTLQLISVCLLLLAMAALVIGMAIMSITLVSAMQNKQAAGAAGAGVDFLFLVGLAVVVILVAYVLSLIGYVFDIWAPARNGAKMLAISTLVLAGFGFLLGCLSPFLGAAAGQAALNPAAASGAGFVLLIFSYLLGVIQHFVYLFFLRALAQCLKCSSLEENIRNLIIFNGAVVGLYIVLVALSIALTGGVGAKPGAEMSGYDIVIGCFGCIDIILGIVALVWYVRALNETRGEITYRLSGRT